MIAWNKIRSSVFAFALGMCHIHFDLSILAHSLNVLLPIPSSTFTLNLSTFNHTPVIWMRYMIVWNKVRSSVFCLGYVSQSFWSLYCVTFIERTVANSFCHIQRRWLLPRSTNIVTYKEYCCKFIQVWIVWSRTSGELNKKPLHIDFCCSSQTRKFSELCHRWSGDRWLSTAEEFLHGAEFMAQQPVGPVQEAQQEEAEEEKTGVTPQTDEEKAAAKFKTPQANGTSEEEAATHGPIRSLMTRCPTMVKMLLVPHAKKQQQHMAAAFTAGWQRYCFACCASQPILMGCITLGPGRMFALTYRVLGLGYYVLLRTTTYYYVLLRTTTYYYVLLRTTT